MPEKPNTAAVTAAAAVSKVIVLPRCFEYRPHYYAEVRRDDKHPHHPINPITKSVNTVPALEDALVYFSSLFLREFVSTICVLVLNSRLGGDLFLASPIVSLYVNIVFRRPLNSPYVLTLGCLSAGDWRKANVAGYPGFIKE